MTVVSGQLSVLGENTGAKPMRGKIFVGLLATLLLGTVAAQAQRPVKVPRIAFLAGGSRSGDSLLLETFWQRMKRLGYIEGENITAEYRFAEGALQRLPNFAAELVRLNVDVIVGPGSGAVAAKKATDAIPIVVAYGDAVNQGLVASLARPGGNVTGLTNLAPELSGKRVELLKETFPKVSRIAVLFWSGRNPIGSSEELMLEDTKVTAGALRMTIQPLELRAVDDFEPAFSAIIRERADALIAMRNPLTATHRTRIVDFVAQRRLPAIYTDWEFVNAGGLMSYGVDVPDLWGRAAVYVDKILKGVKPADLPVEQPTKFELVINLKTAKQIGLTIPPNVLARADKVIK
jgi:putative ABC transport system substrate-binding protein